MVTFSLDNNILLAALSLAVYIFFIADLKKSRAFFLYLNNNIQKLAQGDTIEYQGAKLDLNTELICFGACITFTFPWPGGIQINSRYFIKGFQKTLKVRFVYTIGSILFGWFAVWTIVWVIQDIFNNAIGRDKIKISELISVKTPALR